MPCSSSSSTQHYQRETPAESPGAPAKRMRLLGAPPRGSNPSDSARPARNKQPSTAARRGILLPLGPKLRSKFGP